ncbi:Potassium transporter 26 [Platanthera guangdongensis]|uniref:Potassium transporter 26 n=1 Tax=Platanthera guangdongensis TaxID=2320717 RepID=A0ABR2LPC2_9ASPA
MDAVEAGYGGDELANGTNRDPPPRTYSFIDDYKIPQRKPTVEEDEQDILEGHARGGTFALYSLLRQHVNMKGRMIIPSSRLESDLSLHYHSKGSKLQSKAKKFLEQNSKVQTLITFIVLLGTCMVIGDGALTPAISEDFCSRTCSHVICSNPCGSVPLSEIRHEQSQLLLLADHGSLVFIHRDDRPLQHHQILSVRAESSLAALHILLLSKEPQKGMGNLRLHRTMHHWTVLHQAHHRLTGLHLLHILPAISCGICNLNEDGFATPVLVRRDEVFHGEKLEGDCPEYVFVIRTEEQCSVAKLLHDSSNTEQRIAISYSLAVYPALILAYSGEAAFLIKNPDKLSTAFYSSVPEPIFWPMFVVATLAAVVASQALISASFSIIRQSIALGCFPRVTMIHTSGKHEGQVYSPEVNYFLMVLCILITVGFDGGAEIGNAFGVAVIWVMLITTLLMAVVMLVIWDTNITLVATFLSVFVGIEGVYMSSLLNKLAHGGWVPFAISAFFLVITLSWTYGRSKKSQYEDAKKISPRELNQLVEATTRVSGICIFCTDLVNGIPPIIRHYVQHIGTLRRITVLVTVRTLPVRTVLPEERFIVAKLGPEGVYRCQVQYGYMDQHRMDGDEYVSSIIAVIREVDANAREVDLTDSATCCNDAIFVLGRIILNAGEKNGNFKKWVINNLYRFLQKNFRSNVAALRIPASKSLQVGMLYEI